MTNTKLDARQVTYKGTLLRTATTNPTELDNLIRSLDAEVTPPLMMRADTATLRKVDISSIVVTNLETLEKKTIPPINGIAPDFTSGTIQFPASGNNPVAVTPGADPTMPVMGANEVVKVAVFLNDSSQLELSFGTVGASEALAGTPANIVRTFPIGYIVVRTDGSSQIQDIPQSDVIMYAGGGSGGGGGLVTEYQNSNFTAEVGKHYLVDTSGGAVAVTLPDGGDGDVIRFSDAAKSWATNAMTITPDVSDSIDGDTPGATFGGDTDAGWMLLAFDNTSSNWVVDAPGVTTGTSTPGGGGTGLTTSLVTSGPVTAVAGFHYLVRSSVAGITVNLPAGSTGDVIRISDESGNAGVYNITVNPFAGDTIDGDTSFILDVSNGWIQLSWTDTDWTVDTLAVNDSTGITSLNNQAGVNYPLQTLAVGTSGTDFTIDSVAGVHTFHIPDASASNRGLVTTGAQTIAGAKTFSGAITLSGGVSGNIDATGKGFFNNTLKVTGNLSGSDYEANSLLLDNNAGNSRLYSVGPDAATRGSYEIIGRSSDGSSISTYAVITNGGNVGIGTASPTCPLHVSANAAGSIPALGAVSTHLAVGNSTNYGTMIGTLSSGVGFIQQQRFDGTATAYNLLLQPNGGNVGIGTTSPNNKLDVLVASSDGSSSTHGMRIGTTGVGKLNIGGNDSNSSAWLQVFAGGNLHLQPQSGAVTLGPSGFTGFHNVNGQLAITVRNSSSSNVPAYFTSGGVLSTVASSQRYKTNIQPLGTSLDAVNQLRAVEFDYVFEENPTRKMLGMIAEEVDQVLPNMVVRKEGGEIESIFYQDLPIYLLKAIQELHALVQAQQEEINTLKGGN